MEEVLKKETLRTGFTTGACAAAAAKAAAFILATRVDQKEVEITLPIKKIAKFRIERCKISLNSVLCSVVKDAGDDPDVTHGAEICASASWIDTPNEILINGGRGVGIVTKQGLGLEIGKHAINPVPRKMIDYSVKEALESVLQKRGVMATISVPNGEELTKKTLNRRLGIIGGISILGITGIVRPYSTTAFRASIKQAIGVAKINGCSHVVFTTGERSEKYAMAIYPNLQEEAFIQVGDFVHFAQSSAKRLGVKKITYVGMIGKLSKVAKGIRQTHAVGSRVDTGFLADIAKEAGLDNVFIKEIKDANTARHVLEIVEPLKIRDFFDQICNRIVKVSKARQGSDVTIEAIMTDFDGNIIGRKEG